MERAERPVGVYEEYYLRRLADNHLVGVCERQWLRRWSLEERAAKFGEDANGQLGGMHCRLKGKFLEWANERE